MTKWSRFAAAYSANITADRFVDVAVPVGSLASTGSVRLSGLYIAASSVPKFFAGPLMLPFMRRHPNRSWCGYGNVLQGVGVLILAVSFFLRGSSYWVDGSVVLLVLAGLIVGLGGSMFGLALQASVRNIVSSEKLPRANSTLEVIDSAVTLGCPILVGLLLRQVCCAYVLGIGCLVFFVAALLRYDIFVGFSPELAKLSFASVVHSLQSPFVGRVRTFISVSVLLLATVSGALISSAAAAINFAGGGSSQVGFAVSVAGASGLLMSYIAGRAGRRGYAPRVVISLEVVCFLSLPLLFLSKSIGVIMVVVALNDGIAAWLYVALPSQRMGTESSADLLKISSGFMSWSAISSLLMGMALATFDGRHSLAILAVFVAAGSCLVLLSFGRPIVLDELALRLEDGPPCKG